MSEKWVTAWGNAISVAERRPENYAKDLTLRYPAKMMLDGSALRITLDNFCGSEPVTVTAVSAAVSDGADGIDTETIVPLTFSGKTSVTIPAGEWVQSDAVRFPVKRGETIAVSLYFAGFTEMRSGVVITGPLSGGYFAVGNQTEEAVLGMDTSKKTHTVYFLSDIDVLTDEGNRTLICYGDSITAQAWPDELMLRTLENGDGTTAVIRKAASGTKRDTGFRGICCPHPARHQRYHPPGGNGRQPVPSLERSAYRRGNDRGTTVLCPYRSCCRLAGVHGNAFAHRGMAHLCGFPGKAAQ